MGKEKLPLIRFQYLANELQNIKYGRSVSGTERPTLIPSFFCPGKPFSIQYHLFVYWYYCRYQYVCHPIMCSNMSFNVDHY